jgi:hypothetical protein
MLERIWRCHAATLLTLLFVSGCGGSPAAPPEVEVTGIWMGTLELQDGVGQGSLFLEGFQDGASLTGQVFMRMDYPDLTNFGTDVEGEVHGVTVQFTLQSSDNPHRFTGDVVGDTVSGTFRYHGFTGTWSATRVGDSTVQPVRSFELCREYLDARALTHDGTDLWLLDGSALRDIDTAAETFGAGFFVSVKKIMLTFASALEYRALGRRGSRSLLWASGRE